MSPGSLELQHRASGQHMKREDFVLASSSAGGDVTWFSHDGDPVEHPQDVKTRAALWPSNSSSRYVPPKCEMLIRKDVGTPMFTAT